MHTLFKRSRAVVVVVLACCALASAAKEYHVSISGKDTYPGTSSGPFRTIQHASKLAQPGDTITVHAGTYRERINPPRGGTSDRKRIIYQAARGEKVEIKGSEVARTWTRVRGDVWKTTISNTVFGAFNPYKEVIRGDWFNPKGRVHHPGAVYLNGVWLIEATSLDEVLSEGHTPPRWLAQSGRDYLLNVAWMRTGSEEAPKMPAASFGAQEGIQTAPCTEGGSCIGFIEQGDWVRYDNFDFGSSSREVEFRAASATRGGVVEIRLQDPKGEMLGSAVVPHTGGWQSWVTVKAKIRKLSGIHPVCLVFRERETAAAESVWADYQLWFAEVGEADTVIWAQFRGKDPNRELVEFNVRQTVFYPDKPGRDYITIRGFTMRHAATPWAPPTAEQIGLIGTHWSRGWIIENNEVSHSACSGIALGKYGDPWDNTSADTAEGYVKTIERALANGWDRERIGHHIVRGNTVSHCEQAGIVGSLGAAFCTVTNNTIHDIHARRLFSGAEMAGIKFHAAIDTVISGNRIYSTCLGLWLDWMAQGTRVSRNVFYQNDRDLFVEVNHGPFMVDNNLFLSGASLLDMSEGGAYAHNLFIGYINSHPEPNRETPFHPAHTTKVAGLARIKGGDSRFYNNIFMPGGEPGPQHGLAVYNAREYPLFTGGNVYCGPAQPYSAETDHLVSTSRPTPKLIGDGRSLRLVMGPLPELKRAKTKLVTTALLGRARTPDLPYENPDGSALKVDRDFFDAKRNPKNPTVGPFELTRDWAREIRIR